MAHGLQITSRFRVRSLTLAPRNDGRGVSPPHSFQTPSQTALQTLSALPAPLGCGLKAADAARRATRPMTTDSNSNRASEPDGIRCARANGTFSVGKAKE